MFLAGSLAAEAVHGLDNAHHDVDVFCPTPFVLVSCGQQLVDQGYTLNDRHSRVWHRWLRYGFKHWHTNSLRMESPDGVETNLVYKLTEGHPATSLAQVIESFDFGLLAMGWDIENGTFRDMRSYLFPGMPIGAGDPLPMMPNKRDNWRNGFISRYNGLREMGRYAKYHTYGYDMSLVKDDLVTGYFQGASYLISHGDPEKALLGQIYEVIGTLIEDDDIDELTARSKEIEYADALDQILEALE